MLEALEEAEWQMNPDTDDSFGGGGDGGPSGSSSSSSAAQSQGTTSVEDDFADALADIGRLGGGGGGGGGAPPPRTYSVLRLSDRARFALTKMGTQAETIYREAIGPSQTTAAETP